MLLPQPTPRPKCAKKGCNDDATQDHHVTYAPEVIKPLCEKHHEEITAINGAKARKVHGELSNKHRWFLWFQWQEGKVRPRRTWKHQQWWNAPLTCPECNSEWDHKGLSDPDGKRYLVCKSKHQYQFSKHKRRWELVR